MKVPRLLICLTVLNLGLLLFQLARFRPLEARAQGAAPVLRGRALEIVDDRGKVRASIQVFPEDPTHRTPAGKPYPETVLLRLVDGRGRPNVKIQANVDGGGVGLGGPSDPTYARLGAQGAKTTLTLTNQDGRTRELTP
jgi:hypothetical protein